SRGLMRNKRECNAKDDGVDIDALAAEIEGAGASKEIKGKKKKKGAKKDDFDEDDILKELEELSLEARGGKGKVSAATKSTQFNHRFCSQASSLQKVDTTEHTQSIQPPKPEKKKTRKEKKGASSLDDEEGEEDHPAEERNGQQKGNKKVKSEKDKYFMEYFCSLICDALLNSSPGHFCCSAL
uniref:Eukaryotic translation initiation factor 5B n=1 Tax=Takifugu rubripes TaxID=31033 RepID=A0A3B5K2T4_TAKRU